MIAVQSINVVYIKTPFTFIQLHRPQIRSVIFSQYLYQTLVFTIHFSSVQTEVLAFQVELKAVVGINTHVFCHCKLSINLHVLSAP